MFIKFISTLSAVVVLGLCSSCILDVNIKDKDGEKTLKLDTEKSESVFPFVNKPTSGKSETFSVIPAIETWSFLKQISTGEFDFQNHEGNFVRKEFITHTEDYPDDGLSLWCIRFKDGCKVGIISSLKTGEVIKNLHWVNKEKHGKNL